MNGQSEQSGTPAVEPTLRTEITPPVPAPGIEAKIDVLTAAVSDLRNGVFEIARHLEAMLEPPAAESAHPELPIQASAPQAAVAAAAPAPGAYTYRPPGGFVQHPPGT